MAPLQGQCLCGSIKVTVAETSLPISTLACHCQNCRATTSAAMSLNHLVRKEDLTVTGDSLGVYNDSDTRSGNTVVRHFCHKCGCPVYTVGPSRPDHAVLKLGLFAGKAPIGKPAVELFWANHEQWEAPVSDAKVFEYGPQ